VRLVFSDENSVRFLRIHLAGAIKPEVSEPCRKRFASPES
jgi:hypothetical protein